MTTLDQLIQSRRDHEQLCLGESPEAMFLVGAIDRYLAIRTPFEGVLEAPEAVHEAFRGHAERCNEAAGVLRQARLAVLADVLAALPDPDAAL